MASTHTTDAAKPGFLTLAGEIRNDIYRMLLTNQYVDQSKPLASSSLHPAILRTNRQVYREAVSILQGENNWIIAEIPVCFFPDILHNVQRVFRIDPTFIKYPIMHINLTLPTCKEMIPLVMGEGGIEDLIGGLWEICTEEGDAYDDGYFDPFYEMYEEFRQSSLSLTLCKTPYYKNPSLHSKWLKPFGHVHGLKKLTIHGQVKPALVQEILESASSGFMDLAQIHSVSQAYLGRIKDARSAGEYSRMLQLCFHAEHYLTHTLMAVVSEPKPGTATKHDIVQLEQGIQDLSTCHIMKADLAMGHYDTMKMMAKLTGRNLPDPARTIFNLCVARAHRALGEVKDERRIFEEALNAEGDKSNLVTALADLFPAAATEQTVMLLEQRMRLQMGRHLDKDAIRAFWEDV